MESYGVRGFLLDPHWHLIGQTRFSTYRQLAFSIMIWFEKLMNKAIN